MQQHRYLGTLDFKFAEYIFILTDAVSATVMNKTNFISRNKDSSVKIFIKVLKIHDYEYSVMKRQHILRLDQSFLRFCHFICTSPSNRHFRRSYLPKCKTVKVNM